MAIGNPTHFKVVGNAELIELPKKRRWDLENGVETRRRFAGTKPAIEAEFNRLSAAGAAAGVDDMDEDIDGQAGRLIARVFEDSGAVVGGNTEEINAVWELLGNPVFNPVESHTSFNSIDGQRKNVILKAIENGDPIVPALSGVAELALAGYYSHHFLDYKIGNYTLRKSTVLSKKSEIQASHADVFRVVLMSAINPPTVLLGILTNLQKEDGTLGEWEWMKEIPQIIQVTKTKFRLQYEWTGAEKIAGLYGGSWEPSYSS